GRRAGLVVVTLSLALMGLFAGSRYFLVLAFFLATIIHVFVFTGAFILYGALRSRSAAGLLSLAVFVACALSFFAYAPPAARHPAGAYVRQAFRSFNPLNAELIRLFGFGPGPSARAVHETGPAVVLTR